MTVSSSWGPVTRWLADMPKAELHLHIDGSLTASRLLKLAEKHGISLPYASVADVQAAYNFRDLQSFLDLYYLGASVLRDEEDFYHLMRGYLEICREQNIVHCEIMVEPQTYRPQGVELGTVLAGFQRAMDEARSGWEQSVLLILSFLRHLPEEDCLATLAAAEPYRDHFSAIGLASAERDFPPGGFQRLYQEAAKQGYALTAHAGEEGPAAFVSDALDLLGVTRIDHGVRSAEDAALLERLQREQVPLTVCPLSNLRLRVVDDLGQHPLLSLLEQGLAVTVNSDDPAYFGGYLLENFAALEDAQGVNSAQALAMVRNAFEGSFLTREQKDAMLGRVSDYLIQFPAP